MIPREYEQVEVILTEPERVLEIAGSIPVVDSSPIYNKWNFFKQLERQVYRSKGSEAFLYITPDGFRQFSDLPRLEKNIPYWEIHYYQKGFVNPLEYDGFFDQEANNEQHFYFTLKSFITEEPSLFDYKSGKPVINTGHADCKIDKNYTGRTIDQETYGINIFVLDDEQDSFKYLKTLVPGDIWNCLSKNGKILPYKPSELPQVMFLSYGSSFDAKTEDVASIVCMDRYTHLGTTEPDVTLAIKGNTFLNEGAIVSPTRYGNKNIDSYLGKNTIFGQSCIIRSLYVEDSVVVGRDVNIDFYTILNSGCIITEGVKITAYQKILAGQKVTVKTPLFLNILKNDGGIFLEDFLRKIKVQALLDEILPK